MATNTVFSPQKPAEIWVNGATVGSGIPVVTAAGQAGFTATGTGDYTTSDEVGPYTLSGIPAGGVGLAGKEVSVYVDGTFEFAVTGGTTSTLQNVLVYAVVASGAVTSLTLTSTSNTLFGKVNYPGNGYEKVAGILPVQIGV